jgi:hypothetical protein
MSNNRIDPQRFYDRSRTSGFELLKTLVSLSTAVVGAFFFALTRKVEPPLSGGEFGCLVCALVLMVLAVFAGLLGWGADAKYYDYWADSLNENKSNLDKARANKEFMNKVRRFSIIALTSFFTLGMLVSAIYLILRMERNLE